MPASAIEGASSFTFLESVMPFDHGVFDFGIGLKAARNVNKGEQLCSLPTRWAWSSRVALTDPMLGAMLRQHEGKIRTDDLIAIKLAFHRSLGSDSPWDKHIEVLPVTYDSILFWTDQERAELAGSSTFQLAEVLVQQVAQDYNELCQLLWPANEDNDDDEEEEEEEDGNDDDDEQNATVSQAFFTLENYQWALGTLWSRGHDFVRGTNEHFRCILPGIDLLNMATLVKSANVEIRLVGNRVDMVCIQSVKEGDELRAVYNEDLPNNRLLHLHGFVVHPNPLSYVQLHCELPPQAPLYEVKVKALAEVPTPHKLTLDDPIPRSLLYALVVQRATSDTELTSIMEAANSANEFGEQTTVLRELVLALTQMLGSYKTTEEVDEEILEEQKNESEEDSAGLSTGKRRLRLATRLRYDEKQILRKGLSVLMAMLSDGTSSSDEGEDSETDDIDIDD